MVIHQGDVLFVDFGPPKGSAPGYWRPAAVVQDDRFNQSKINTLVVVAMTSNLKFQHSPGNARLRRGEANLDVETVANVTQIATIDRSQVLRKIGTLSTQRTRQIIAGIGAVLGADML